MKCRWATGFRVVLQLGFVAFLRAEFGDKQGLPTDLHDVAGTAHGVPPDRQCCAMYIASPSTQIGLTWGTLPEQKRRRWQELGCDQFQSWLEDVRSQHGPCHSTDSGSGAAGANDEGDGDDDDDDDSGGVVHARGSGADALDNGRFARCKTHSDCSRVRGRWFCATSPGLHFCLPCAQCEDGRDEYMRSWNCSLICRSRAELQGYAWCKDAYRSNPWMVVGRSWGAMDSLAQSKWRHYRCSSYKARLDRTKFGRAKQTGLAAYAASNYTLTGRVARDRFGFYSMRQWQDILTAATPPHLPDAEASSKLIQAKPGAAKNVLSVCTLMKDRARYLREWLQYHLLVGVEHFYLYDHGSVDGLAEAIAPFIAAGAVTVHDWKWHLADQDPQGHARTHCFVHHRSDTQYLAMIDIDEFLFSRAGKNVRCIIQALMCSADVIRITWTVFTSSGHKARPKGLVIDSYNERCQQGGGGANFRSKYIVKTSALVTERDMRHCGVHQCLPVSSTLGVVQPADEAVLQLHHYSTLSLEDFLKREPNGAGRKGNAGRNTYGNFLGIDACHGSKGKLHESLLLSLYPPRGRGP